MNTFNQTLDSIEKYLDFLKEAAKEGAGNVPVLNKRTKNEYQEALENVEYWNFVQSADYHYFISRILILHHIREYSQFSGYQCIENYLKAYLKYKGQIPPKSHDLQELLQLCRENETELGSFIHGDRISVVIAKYEPFYELARYPVQKHHPKNGYVLLVPYDIYVLDYFVMRMREILPIPTNTWDILKNGHYSLHQCQRMCPDFYQMFLADNINFREKS